MNVTAALVETAQEQELSTEQIAVDAKAGFATVRDWLAGKSTPGGDRLLRLMQKYPAFAKRLGFDPIFQDAAAA